MATQFVGRVESLNPVGIIDRHRAKAIPRVALGIAQFGQQPDHVGDIVFPLGVVVADSPHALIKDLGPHQIKAGIDARAEPVEFAA
jgi:hypothetical protein